jgi:hypothetical protein
LSNDEVVAACRAIEDGDFAKARHHINNLALEGSNPSQVEELEKLIWRKESEAGQVGLSRIGYALAIAVLGYAALSFQSPTAWGPAIWGIAAFFVLPIIAGALAGASVLAGQNSVQKARRFWRGFIVVGLSMGVYCLIGMGLVRHKMQSSDKSMDFVVFVFVAAAYGVIAGLVAGVAGSTVGAKRKAS